MFMRVFLAISILILFSNFEVLHIDAQDCLPTRLEIGGEARVTPGAANRIRSEASTDSEQIGQIPAGEVAAILEGPQCAGGFLWWRITYDGVEGWTVEASATDYFLEPYSDEIEVTATDSAESCNTETRLQIDGYGQMNANIPGRLRDAPGTDGEQIGQVDPIDIFRVIDRPICVDGFNWWLVEVDDLTGWLAEGDSESFYVEPVTDPDIIEQLSTPEPSLISYAASWNADGSRFAIATENGVFIYNTTDWDEAPYLLDDGILATELAFSTTNPDLLVIDGTENIFRFRAYELSDADESILFEIALMDGPMGGDRPANDFAFSADGSQLSFGGSSYEIYDTETWTRLNYLEISEVAGNHYVPVIISPSDLSANGNYGAGAIDDGIVHIFDLTRPHTVDFGEEDPRISTFDRGGRIQDITALRFSPDGAQLIIGDNTGSLQMWDIETGNRTSFIRAENQASISNRINEIEFHPDGETVATAESDPAGIVRIFDTENLDTITVFGTDQAHTVAYIVAYSPDGTVLLTVLDDTIYVLDTTFYTVISSVSIQAP